MRLPRSWRNLIAIVPYSIRIVLTHNGIQFINRPTDRNAFSTSSTASATKRYRTQAHQGEHPWTNGQAEE